MSQVDEPTEAIKPVVVSEEVKSFYKRYGLAMENWLKVHGNTNFPVYEDPKTGKLHWVNRDKRKLLAKERKKKANK